jgi:uncharacterized protein
MRVSMYSISIPVFIQHLNGLNSVLDKAASWAVARKVNEADLLNMRLSPDMFNLARQVRAATDHAANAAGRLSGKELLKFANDETTIAQLKDRIGKTIELPQEHQAKRDRRHRDQGHQHHLPKRTDTAVHGPEPLAWQQPTQLLLPRRDRLRHHSPVRSGDRKTRFYGRAADMTNVAFGGKADIDWGRRKPLP